MDDFVQISNVQLNNGNHLAVSSTDMNIFMKIGIVKMLWAVLQLCCGYCTFKLMLAVLYMPMCFR